MNIHALRMGTVGSVAVAVSLLLSGCPVHLPQTWHRYLGNDDGDDKAAAIVAAPGGGYVIAGTAEDKHETDTDILLTKIGENGLRIWEYIAGSEDNDHATCVVPAHGGGFIVGGELGTGEETDVDGFVTKVSDAGEEVWTSRFHSGEVDQVVSVAATTDGAYAVLLNADYLGEGEVTVIKLSAEGSELWRTTVATGAVAIKVVALEDGASAVLSWAFDPLAGSSGAFTITQLSGAGTVGTSFTVSGDNALLPRDFARIGDGWLITGQDNILEQDAHATLLRLKADGELLWEKTLGGPGRDEARALSIATNGDIFLAGAIMSDEGKSEFYLARVSPEGDVLWERAYGDDDEDDAHGVAAAPCGGAVLVGVSDSLEDNADEENYDILVIRTDAAGHSEGIEVPLPSAE
jgi:hypothetical protein